MFTKLLIKRILPSIIGLAILIVAGMWLYGVFGVKCGWVKPLDLKDMNAITKSGVDAAGGTAAVLKSAVGL